MAVEVGPGGDGGVQLAQFVARHARAAHVLQDGDTVLCFSPITGG